MAAEAVADDMPGPDGAEGPDTFDAYAGCRIMPLPPRLQQKGAELAERLNPANAPLRELAVDSDGELESPLRLTLRTTKYWGPTPKAMTVSFMETTAADLRTRIVSHLNAWADYCGITFSETSGTGDVRISRGSGGYWSYLGTDIKLIPVNRQTMNLQGFTMSTPDSEYHRVIRHEAGHTLAFPHEHMRQALVDRIDHRHRARPGLDHVLPAARGDHEGRRAHPRRNGHQRQRRPLRRTHLPQGPDRPGRRPGDEVRERRGPGAAGDLDRRLGPAGRRAGDHALTRAVGTPAGSPR